MILRYAKTSEDPIDFLERTIKEEKEEEEEDLNEEPHSNLSNLTGPIAFGVRSDR